eukprot:185743_1
MGSTLSDWCVGSGVSLIRVKTTSVPSTDWADAVSKLNVTGIKVLHASNAELIDYPTDEYGSRAIHMVIKHKHYSLLRYLLEHDADINVKGGKNGNTPLHEAVLIEDNISMKWLFAFNANPELTNRLRKKPFDICSRHFKKNYIRAKLSSDKYRSGTNNRNKIFGSQSSSPITVAGVSIEKTHSHNFIKNTNDERIYYKIKKEEIKNRKAPITAFGAVVGIDLDEIGLTLQKVPTKHRLWNVWIHEHVSTVNTQNDVYKILCGLTWICLKKKHATKATKPPAKYMKQVTKTLWLRYLPRDCRAKPNLTKHDFVQNFHSYLYQLHDQMLSKQKV